MSSTELTGFISYSHKDLKMKTRFVNHLAPLKKIYNINIWHDGLILPGKPVNQSVMHQLRHADIVFILVSADYITSDFCYNVELQEAINRHNEGKCVVVPVILKPIGVSLRSLAFGSLLMVPEDAKPISKFKPLDSGYANAVSKVEALLSQHFSKAAFTAPEQNSNSTLVDAPTITHTNTAISSVSEEAISVSSDAVGLKIYQNGILAPYAVSQSLIDFYPVLCERLTNFTTKVQRYNAATIQTYNAKNKSIAWWQRKIDHYFFDFLSYISKELLGNMTGVRIHIRKLEGAYYKGIRAVTLTQDGVMNVKIPTTMPAKSSMIEAANRVDAPLIKSFNENYHHNGSSAEWVDYVTCVFKKLDSGLQPILSLGISIDSTNYEYKRDWLILFAHTRIDNIIQGLMLDFFSECKQLDHNFDLKTILSAQAKKGGRKNG